MHYIQTQRMKLIALDEEQLGWFLKQPEKLEQALKIKVSRGVVTDTVRRAIGIKLTRMARTHVRNHPWYTYWLMVVEDEGFGAGMIGFKGIPDHNGAVEIGYGIDPEFQNKGYTTEAVRALIRWALHRPGCNLVTAQAVKNPASNRVLEKVGMQIYKKTEDTVSWQITRELWKQVKGGGG